MKYTISVLLLLLSLSSYSQDSTYTYIEAWVVRTGSGLAIEIDQGQEVKKGSSYNRFIAGSEGGIKKFVSRISGISHLLEMGWEVFAVAGSNTPNGFNLIYIMRIPASISDEIPLHIKKQK